MRLIAAITRGGPTDVKRWASSGPAFTRSEDVEHEAGRLFEHGEKRRQARGIAPDLEGARRHRVPRGELALLDGSERAARRGDRGGRRVRPLAQAMAQGAIFEGERQP